MEAIISTSYKRERDSELYIVAKRIVESMKNNANFPNPPAALTALEKLLPEYDGSLTVTIAFFLAFLSEQPTSETVWTNEGITNPSYTFRGLKSFTKYWFRIVALGPNGQTEYSPVDFRIIQ